MTTQIIKANKEKLEELCRANIVGARVNGSYISVKLPESEREAEHLSYFWSHIFRNNKEDIKEISFAYREKDKELPLSSLNKFLNKIGFDIKPKVEEGQIGESFVRPELIRYEKGKILNVITNKENWTQANKIAQKSNTFSAPRVMLLENLCYQVNIPLECVKSVEFKGDFY